MTARAVRILTWMISERVGVGENVAEAWRTRTPHSAPAYVVCAGPLAGNVGSKSQRDHVTS